MLQILGTFRHDFAAGTMKDFADRTGIPESTLFRLLGRMVAADLLWHDASAGRYGPGLKLLELGDIALRQLHVPTDVQRVLNELQEATRETASFSVWRGGTTRTLVAVSNSLLTLREFTVVGDTHDLWLGASGKAIAAFVPADEQAELVAVAASRGADANRLRADLSAIRRTGFAKTEGERVPGVMAVSAPVFKGELPVGSLTVSGPSFRISPLATDHATLVRRFAAELSRILEGRASRDGEQEEDE